MNNLVIVESPTKAKTLSRFLSGDYYIEATMGHVRDLPEKKLGIEIQSVNSQQSTVNNYTFIPQYQIISGRKERVSELKKLASDSPSIILATDPDREGEAIAWHICELLKLENGSGRLDKEVRNKRLEKDQTSNIQLQDPTSKFQHPTSIRRIVFHEITESAIKHALESPRSIDMQLVDAQQARRILDRLVGYKLSPLLWNKLGKRWLSAGRVQSVVVRLIVDREREILAFKSEEYWIIDVELQKINSVIANEVKQSIGIASSPSAPRNDNLSFLARLAEINDKKADLGNKESADRAVSDLKAADYKVSNIEVKDLRRYPAPPFTTSTLQQAAANKFGWTAKRTMRAAQNLYEEGFITYHRTDSTNLATEAINMVRDYINNVYGKQYLPDAPKFYKTKSKVAQEAHEAIRPTEVGQISNLKSQISNQVGRDGMVLYELIWKRFVACQMNEAVIEQTNVDVETSQMSLRAIAKQSLKIAASPSAPRNDKITYLLKSQGEKMKFDGWLTLYERTQNSKLKTQNSRGENYKELPSLSVSEPLNFIQIFPQQKFTEPPARYTEATLIKVLEEKGIGRPSTYAPIISTIQDRKYVEKEERKFKPTDLGFAVNDFLVANFPDIFDIGFTARMEDELDEIANGKMEWNGVISDFYAPFISKLDTVFKEAGRVKVDLGTTDEKCPDCGSNLVYRLSKYGKFLACSKYPQCKFTKNVIEKAGIPCPRCGADMIVKKTRRGKQFYGCGNYPKCTFAAWKKEDIK